MSAPANLTYGRHAISARKQQRKDAAYELDSWLIAHYHAVQVVLVLLGALTATVVALAATGRPMTAMGLGLVGGLAIVLGIAFEAMGGKAGETEMSKERG